MYSRLDSIFKTNLWQAEAADTHLGIRREEKDLPHKKREKKEEPEGEEESFWDDSTHLSVVTLKTFLEDLLQQTSLTARPRNEDLPDEERNRQTAANKAAQAYQSTARAAHSEEAEKSHLPHLDHSEGEVLHISSDEKTAIKQLIHDLGILQEQGVGEVILMRAENFLQSLVNAVENSLKAIPGYE